MAAMPSSPASALAPGAKSCTTGSSSAAALSERLQMETRVTLADDRLHELRVTLHFVIWKCRLSCAGEKLLVGYWHVRDAVSCPSMKLASGVLACNKVRCRGSRLSSGTYASFTKVPAPSRARRMGCSDINVVLIRRVAAA